MNNLLKNKFIYNQTDYNNYNKVLNDYLKLIPEDHELIACLIEDMVDQRDINYKELYTSVERVIKGEPIDITKGIDFPIDVGNSDALYIMNNKASIFDVNSISITLKQTKTNKKDSEDPNRREPFIDTANRILNESYLTRPQYKFAFADAIRYSRGYPMAITLLGWDDNAVLGNGTNFKGDVTCENIPLENFYWDPASTSIDTSNYVMITKMLNYRQIYGFVSKLKDKNIPLLDAFTYIANTQASITPSTNLVDNQTLIKNGAIELVVFYQKEIDKDKTKIKISYVVGKQYVIGSQYIDIPYLPFAILKEYSANNSFTGISSVMLAEPYIKQKAVIDGICNNIALMQKDPRYLFDANSGIDMQEFLNFDGSSSGKAFSVNSGTNISNAVQIVPSPQIQSDLFAWKQSVQQDIERVISATDVNNFGSKLSGTAVQNMIDQSTIKENTSIIELERYLERFIRILMHFLKIKLPQIKTNETLDFRVKSMDPNTPNELEIIGITPDEFEELEADIIIDASLLRTSKQQKQLQELMQVYQWQLQYLGQNDDITMLDIIDKLDIPDKQLIINRIKENTQANKVQQAIQLVNGVLQVMQTEGMENLGVEEATALVLQNIQGGNK